MNFKEEYKNELQRISPTEDQCERIRNGVMKKLSEEAPVKRDRKKPLYLRIAAISGTAVCAAAVLIVVLAGGNYTVSKDHTGTAPGNMMNAGGNNAEQNDALNHPYGTADGAPMSPTDIGAESYQSPSISGNYTGDGATHTVSPSQNKTTPPSQNEAPPLTEPSDSVPYLLFSKDESSCEVTINGKTILYHISEPLSGGIEDPGFTGGGEDPSAGGDENPAAGGGEEPSNPPVGGASQVDPPISASSNLGTELFVQFDGKTMTVYYSEGNIFGIYTQ